MVYLSVLEYSNLTILKRAEAIVKAVTYYNNPVKLAEISEDLGGAMSGISVDSLEDEEKLAVRGW